MPEHKSSSIQGYSWDRERKKKVKKRERGKKGVIHLRHNAVSIFFLQQCLPSMRFVIGILLLKCHQSIKDVLKLDWFIHWIACIVNIMDSFFRNSFHTVAYRTHKQPIFFVCFPSFLDIFFYFPSLFSCCRCPLWSRKLLLQYLNL